MLGYTPAQIADLTPAQQAVAYHAAMERLSVMLGGGLGTSTKPGAMRFDTKEEFLAWKEAKNGS